MFSENESSEQEVEQQQAETPKTFRPPPSLALEGLPVPGKHEKVAGDVTDNSQLTPGLGF